MVYVTMTDTFMSGWGQAKGRINKLVISCNDTSEAWIVLKNAEARSEMKNVSIRATKPCYNPDRYCVSWHGREQGDYDSWFISGYFQPRS